jgi:predicted amidophosphoribosyltransferase
VSFKVLNALFPVRCVVCAAGGGKQLCAPCRMTLNRLQPPFCERCGAPTAWPVARCRECSGRRLAFASARAAVEYDEPVRRLVVAWKERGLRRLAADAAELMISELAPPRAPLLTFVPPDRERGRWRGHHPAERLSQELGRQWELPVRPLLRRTRHVPRQRGLALADRRRNVAGTFAPAAGAPAQVALVDDVYTSGATVAAAASALRKAGARRVEVLTFARVVR